MIRIACAAATLLTATMLPLQSAGAAITLNSRISQVVHALHDDSHMSRDFTLTIGGEELFSGIAGVHAFNDVDRLNDWVDDLGKPDDVFDGAPYAFTYSLLGSYFDLLRQAPKPSAVVLEAVVADVPSLAAASPAVPEPATWAMMIGGLALVGMQMRRRAMAVSFA